MERPKKTPFEFLRDAVLEEVEDTRSNERSIGVVYALAIAGIPPQHTAIWNQINEAIRARAKRLSKPDLPALERVKKEAWRRHEATASRTAA